MPIVDKKTLQKSLKYEIEEREITTNLDDVYYNWQISESVDDEPSTEYDVLLAVIEKRIIKEFAKLKTIKWKIENIELQPITVGRLVRGDSVAIDFGHEATRIYMYKDGNLSNLETINIGGKHLSEIISKEFKYKTEEEIEGIKYQSYIISDFIDESNSYELQRASELVTNEVKTYLIE